MIDRYIDNHVPEDALTAALRHRIAALEAENAALREALAKPDVPPGYALVPVEPTPEMCQSAQKAGFFQSHVPIIWKALLSAAPQPKDKP